MKYIGNINKKVISGGEYYYHQYRENGKMISKSISIEEAYDLAFKIYYSNDYDLDDFNSHKFKTDVSYGASLFSLERGYRQYKKRYSYEEIIDYINGQQTGKVLILYGLRRTGKTTLIFQTIASLSFKEYAKAAFIRLNNTNVYNDLRDDLDYLTKHGFKYIFIDEVTLLDDFISLASVFSDIYGTRSKIVLSGTDSLGLYISKYDELFDRAIFIHTTYISFKEFADVLGINDVDTYIEYGGTMSIDTHHYHNSAFSDNNYTNYIDSAIAHNIVHSLKNYQDGSHFLHLLPLYEKGELVNVINRIIEDQNHRFAISVIERDFKSNDLGSLRQLLRLHKDELISSSLDNIDENQIIETLMRSLDIINKDKLKNPIDETILKEVEIYLDILDVTKSINEISLIGRRVTYQKKVIIQPGIRYAQAKALINILLNDESVKALPPHIINFIREKLDSDIKGRLLEEIVLYQTSLKNKETFKLMLPIGEIDMVNLDVTNRESFICEIKHSHLVDEHQYI